MKSVLPRTLSIELALLAMVIAAVPAKRAQAAKTAVQSKDLIHSEIASPLQGENRVVKTPATTSAIAQPVLPTQTTAKAAHSLSFDQATRGYPIHLHAVVTYYDPDTDADVGAFFACDQTGCICVLTPRRPVLPL